MKSKESDLMSRATAVTLIEEADRWQRAYARERDRNAELIEAATALYERVEMDESVGICLSSRVEALTLGDLLNRERNQNV